MSKTETERDALPVAALLMLAMTGFTAIVTETLPAGLLPQIARDLAISPSVTGQMVSVYAIGSLVAAIPLVSVTQTMPRKPVLMAALIGFLIFNLVTALSGSFVLTMAARFMAGVSAGLSWGLLGGYARRLVTEPLKGRALAVAMVGTPIALSVGVPLGTFAGSLIGWRGTFLAMSGVAAVLLGVIAWRMPDVPGQAPEQRVTLRGVLTTPGVRPILITAFAWVTAQYVLYTYVAPFAGAIGRGDEVSLLLLVFGVAALGGIWVAGAMVDGHLRLHVLASLVAFAAITVLFGLVPGRGAVLLTAIALWGASFGGAATSIQTAASDAAPDGVDIVGAMLTTVWNAGIAAGGALGALVLAHGDATDLTWAMLGPIGMALAIVAVARRHGFRAGSRSVIKPASPSH
jgi:predicted MFS family arabinose efflux permease